MNPYHYVQCGLNNVWLRNGFELQDTPYGRAVSIQNVEGLNEAIAKALADKPDQLSGDELRFLRHQLGMSQKRLGEVVGKEDQTIAKWEKRKKISKDLDFLIRHIYKQTLNGSQSYVEMVDHLNRLDRQEYESLEFEKNQQEWKKSA